MKKILFAFSGALLLLASCVNESELSDKLAGKDGIREDGITVVSASLNTSDDARTYFGAHEGSSYSVYWQAADAIQINGCNSTAITITPGHPSGATFDIGGAVEYPYCAVYPAALASDYHSDTVMVNLPSVQAYTAGSYDPAAGVMLGYATEGEVGFHSAMAFLKLNISGGSSAAAIKSVRVRSNITMGVTDQDYGRQSMSGAFLAKFSADGCTLTREPKDGSSITLDCGVGVAQGTDLFIAIPAQTYTRGINLFILDTEGHCQEIVSNKAFTAQPATVYPTTVAYDGTMTYEGPGIYTEADWNSLAAQITVAGFCNEFQDESGDYNLLADLNATSLMRFGGTKDGVANSDFSGVLNGNGHSITTTTMAVPLFTYISGTVRNLNIGGVRPSINNSGWGTASLALRLDDGAVVDGVNAAYEVTAVPTVDDIVYYYGLVRNIKAGATMQNCIQASNFSITPSDITTKDMYVLPFAYSNDGVVKDCVNTGDVTFAGAVNQKTIVAPFYVTRTTLQDFTNTGNFSVASSIGGCVAGVTIFGGGNLTRCTNGEEGSADTKGVLTFTATPAAKGKTYHLGGIAGYGDGNVATNCGRFYACANYGDLSLVKTENPLIYRSSVGGIIADIRVGAYAKSEGHDYTTIDGCTNDGHLTFWEQKSDAATSTAAPAFVGGILGCALHKNGTNSGSLVFFKTTSEMNGLFLVIRRNCKNTGTLEVASPNPTPSGDNNTGARLNYVGGIAGFTYGMGRVNTSGTSDAHYAVVRGQQDGIIKVGSNASGSIAAGGILGGGCYTKVEQVDQCDVTYEATELEMNGASAAYRGTLGATIGWIVKYSQMGTADLPVNANMTENTGLLCSASIPNDYQFVGYTGVTGATSVHRSSTKEKHRIDIYGTPSLNGEEVTADMCYGGGNKVFN